MSIPDDTTVYVRSSRCEDLLDPGSPSSKYACAECGRLVWISHDMEAALARRFPDAPFLAICMQCGIPGEHEVTNLPEHVEALRANGDSDFAITYKLAIAAVATGAGSFEEVEEDICANPTGPRAQAFPEALRKAALLVASTYLPPN